MSADKLTRCLAVVFFALVAFYPWRCFGDNGGKNVLVLHSYHHELKWVHNIEDGLRNVFKELPVPTEMRSEFMDSKRVFNPEYLGQLEKIYLEKYRNQHLDVIVATDNNALEFIVERGDKVFPGVPVVFLGVNGFNADMLKGRKNITGVAEDVGIPGTIKAALALFPKTRRVVAYVSDFPTALKNKKTFLQARKNFPGHVKFEIVDSVNIDRAAKHISTLGPDTVAVLISFLRDEHGQLQLMEDSASRLGKAASCPVFGLWDFILGHGIVGGKLISGYSQGEVAAGLAVRIMNGESPDSIPIVLDSPNQYMFDWEALNRFDYDPTGLPADSVFINKTETLYEKTRKIVWTAIGIIVVMGLAIAFFILNLVGRRKAEKALVDSKQEFESIFENSQVGIMLLRGGRFLARGNQRLADILGYDSTDELVGIGMRQIHLDEEHFQHFGETYYKKLKDGEQIQVEYLIRRKDGRATWCLLSGKALDSENLDRGVIWVVDDLEPRKAMERDLLEAKELAEAANRSKSEFLANMSHEIRTPINGLMGMLQLLQTTSQDKEQQEYTDIAIQSGKRLTTLLGDILDLSRVEAGKMEIRMEEFDLPEVVKAVDDLFGFGARQKQVELRFELDENLPRRLVGDGQRLQQILFNIVGNALKFTEHGSIVVEVGRLASADASKTRILFSVVDTGMGMPPETLDKLFNPFTQADGSHTRQFQGAGLGLSIVKRLVELMGGTVAVSSGPGEGTEFYVSIPFSPAKDGQPREHSGAVKRELAPKGRRVLVVEDDKVSRLAITALLKKRGLDVRDVDTGWQALNSLRETRFNLIFMDIQLPLMDGVEVTKIIRSSPDFADSSDIPIIALTAHAMSGDKERFLNAGMDGYLAKPVEVELLDILLERFLAFD